MKTDSALNSTNRPQPGADLWKSVLDSLTAEVAVLDHDGVIIAVNEAWRRIRCREQRVARGGRNRRQLPRRLPIRARRGFTAGGGGVPRNPSGPPWLPRRFQARIPLPCSRRRIDGFCCMCRRLDSEQPFVVAAHLSITDRKLTEQRLLEAERLAAIADAMQGLSHEGRNALQRSQAHMELLRLHIEDDPEALDLFDRIESCAQTSAWFVRRGPALCGADRIALRTEAIE